MKKAIFLIFIVSVSIIPEIKTQNNGYFFIRDVKFGGEKLLKDMKIENEGSYVDRGDEIRIEVYDKNGYADLTYSVNLLEGDYHLSFLSRCENGFIDARWDLASCYVNEEKVCDIAYTLHSYKRITRKLHLNGDTNLRFHFEGVIPNTDKFIIYIKDISLTEDPTEEIIFKEDHKKWHDLEFNIETKDFGEYKEYRGAVKNLSNEERCVDTGFFVPLDVSEWVWWDDIRNYRVVDKGLYQYTMTADETADMPISIYPLSALNNNEKGLSFGIDLKDPSVYHIYYDAEKKRYGIVFNLGLLPYGETNFKFITYEYEPEWGFRAALQKYYDIYPENFSGKLDLIGQSDPPEEMENPRGYGFLGVQDALMFDENHVKKVYPFYKEKNLMIFLYTLPWADEPSGDMKTEPPPTYDEALLYQQKRGEDKAWYSMKSYGAKESFVYETNGDIMLSDMMVAGWRPDVWTVRFPLNLDPEGGIAKTMMRSYIIPALELGEKYGYTLNIEMDNFMKESFFLDSNIKENYHLTYSFNTYTPAVHLFSKDVEYLKYLDKYLEENYSGSLLSANCVSKASFGYVYLDAIPFETSMMGFNWGDEEYNFRRIMAYHKPVAAHYAYHGGELKFGDIEDKLRYFMDTCTFYGIYPAIPKILKVLDDKEKALNLYRKYDPILQKLFYAGWEPITYAESDVWVERFGNNYFTLRNDSEERKEFILKIGMDKLGIEDFYIRELFSNSEVKYTIEDGKIVLKGEIENIKVFEICERETPKSFPTTQAPRSIYIGIFGSVIVLIFLVFYVVRKK